MEKIYNDKIIIPKKSTAFIAVKSFFGPIILSLFFSIILFGGNIYLHWQYFVPLLVAIIFFTFILLYSQYYSNQFYIEVIVTTLGLSFIFSLGLHLMIANWFNNPSLHSFGLYLMILSLFHYGEFQITSLVNIDSVTMTTFLLNNGYEYHLALLISFIEFSLESICFFDWKFFFFPYITYVGFIICLIGDGIRKLAMYTAGRNFNHLIQTDYFPEHQLITTGIYSIFRHPSYVGWFYWSIATQILLQNPISIIGYTIVSWRFFKDRIQFEEITLINFFGSKYLIYKKEVPTGLPWINGYG